MRPLTPAQKERDLAAKRRRRGEQTDTRYERSGRAYQRALGALRDLHRDEFRVLLDKARKEQGL